MTIASLCIHVVDHYTAVKTTGTAGSTSFTWPTKTATLKCRIQPASASELDYARKRDTEISHVVDFPDDPGIETRDKLFFGSRTFDVNMKATNTDELNRLYKALVMETDQRQ